MAMFWYGCEMKLATRLQGIGVRHAEDEEKRFLGLFGGILKNRRWLYFLCRSTSTPAWYGAAFRFGASVGKRGDRRAAPEAFLVVDAELWVWESVLVC